MKKKKTAALRIPPTRWFVLMFLVSVITTECVIVLSSVLLSLQADASNIKLAQAGGEIITAKVTVLAATSTAQIRWAVPEMRAGTPGTNDDSLFYLTVRSGGTVIYTTPIIGRTAVDGSYMTLIPLEYNLSGTYDIGYKGHQHLTKIARAIPLNGSNVVLNFTQPTYDDVTKGNETLVAGDINGTILLPQQMGDDKINAIDVTKLLSEFNSTDKYARSNLNQDGKVNALDMTIILKNFNRVGER